jgi:hypothetical protein
MDDFYLFSKRCCQENRVPGCVACVMSAHLTHCICMHDGKLLFLSHRLSLLRGSLVLLLNCLTLHQWLLVRLSTASSLIAEGHKIPVQIRLFSRQGGVGKPAASYMYWAGVLRVGTTASLVGVSLILPPLFLAHHLHLHDAADSCAFWVGS